MCVWGGGGEGVFVAWWWELDCRCQSDITKNADGKR